MTIILNGTAGITYPNGQTQNEGLPSSGAAGNVLTSTGTGWESATPSPNNALASTFPLKSGASLAAGRVVNLNSSGEVGDYPVSNSLGSVVTNTGGYSYSAFSTDGSRALYFTYAEATPGIGTLTMRGMAITGSGFTNGTVTVTSSINIRSGQGGGIDYNGYGWNAVPINATQFLVFYRIFGYGQFGECLSTPKRRSVAFVVTVDSSGNCTKGNETSIFSRDSPTNQGEGGFSGVIYRFVNNLFGASIYGGNVAGGVGYYLSVSDTTVTSTQDNDFYNYYGSQVTGSTFGQVTSNNIAVNTNGSDENGNTLYIATWNGSALGTVTSQGLVSPNSYRAKSRLVSPTLALVVHSDTSNVLKASTFTINQSTGAATLFASAILDSALGTVAGFDIALAAESSTKYLATIRNANRTFAYSFEIDSSGNIIGEGIRLPTGLTDGYYISYTGSASTYRSSNGGTLTQNIVVNSYNTPQWNSLGVSATAQNTSPATIVTDGVVGGFTGLTPGLTYYVNQSAYDGTITTTEGSFAIGLAVSSTQLSLGV
jgi:hypothetical protein